jgi:hypothetical protein
MYFDDKIDPRRTAPDLSPLGDDVKPDERSVQTLVVVPLHGTDERSW